MLTEIKHINGTVTFASGLRITGEFEVSDMYHDALDPNVLPLFPPYPTGTKVKCGGYAGYTYVAPYDGLHVLCTPDGDLTTFLGDSISIDQ